MPRIVSLIASATEIVCALGLEDQLVGRSHECDFPESVRRLPACTAPKFDVHGSSQEIDQRVKSLLLEGTSVYRVDIELLRQLQPDVIITQAQCDVCAVSLRDVERALAELVGSRPTVVSLNPNALADVWNDIREVARVLGVPSQGQTLVSALQARLADVADHAARLADRPTAACLEWIDPLMAAGNWMPELVQLAGGIDPFGTAGKHAPWLSWKELCDRDPEVIVALPCGFDQARTMSEMVHLAGRPEWPTLRAVRNRRVYVADGNQFFNRPGPRLADSCEMLGEMLHPEVFPPIHESLGWRRYAGPQYTCGMSTKAGRGES
jgi:iron complex transport system substrate-binding protein